MEVNEVGTAEKEACEVLHSLLSVERVEKPLQGNAMQQIVVVQDEDSKEKIHWHTPVQQPIFTSLEQGRYVQTEDTVVWEGTLSTLEMDAITDQNHFILGENNECLIAQDAPQQQQALQTGQNKPAKKPVRKKYKKVFNVDERTVELENNVQDVRARFQLGCECNDDSCFRGLNPETVYRHRLNIAELTKEEHDMYLMGVTMACMSDPGVTVKRKERRRLRAHYVYQGRKVCLSAFLYLENCTLYQLKRIRKHVMTHGVTPRVHGNHGKKPHNVFSLDIYRRATNFLKSYIEHHTNSSGNLKTPVMLPSDISRTTIHNTYQEYVKSIAPPDEKIMGYSTFRHFMKEQFPHVRFCKSEQGASGNTSHCNSGAAKQRNSKSDQDQQQQHATALTANAGNLMTGDQVATIPIILPSPSVDKGKVVASEGPTYIVTPMQQIVQQEFATYQPHTITVAPAYAFTTM